MVYNVDNWKVRCKVFAAAVAINQIKYFVCARANGRQCDKDMETPAAIRLLSGVKRHEASARKSFEPIDTMGCTTVQVQR